MQGRPRINLPGVPLYPLGFWIPQCLHLIVVVGSLIFPIVSCEDFLHVDQIYLTCTVSK